MDYDALMAFATFAEHCNFTHAARALGISQPALHAKIKKLAEALEMELYVRRGQRLELTVKGERVAAHAREVEALSQSVLAELSQQRARPARLAAGPGTLLYTLGEFVRAHAKDERHPVSVVSMNASQATNQLLEAHVDVAVSVFSQRHPDLMYHPWVRSHSCVLMPVTHRHAHKAKLTPRDLEGEALIVPQEGKINRHLTEKILAEHGVNWRVAMEALGWELAVRYVDYGLGLAIVNDFVEAPSTLVSIPISGFPDVLYEVARRARTRDEAILWLYDRLVAWSMQHHNC